MTQTKNGFTSKLQHNGVLYQLGTYSTAEEAAMAYDRKLEELVGRDAQSKRFNFVSEPSQRRHAALNDASLIAHSLCGAFMQHLTASDCNRGVHKHEDGSMLPSTTDDAVPSIGVDLLEERADGEKTSADGYDIVQNDEACKTLPQAVDVNAEADAAEIPHDAQPRTPTEGPGRSKAEHWYRLPKQELTQSLRDDLRVLQLRGALNPKRFYKRPDNKKLPTRFQIGTVVEHAQDFYSSRLRRSERAPNITQEALQDETSRSFRKRKWHELQQESSKVLVPPKKKSTKGPSMGKRRKGKSKL